MTTVTSWLDWEGTGMKHTFAVSIGGAAGQGVATPGNIFARIFARRGLHLNAYNAYQSIIRGGHTFLTIRTGPERVTSFGDTIDLLIPLNQDTMDRHLGLLGPGAAVVYNGDTVKPGTPADGVQLLSLAGFGTDAWQPQQSGAEHVGSRRGTEHDGHRVPASGRSPYPPV